MTVLLEIAGLTAGFGGHEVLRGIDLAVAEGQVLALMGRNGAGKTTLMRRLMGLIKPGAGMIRYRGQDMTKAPTHLLARAGIGYVPQGRMIFDDVTVADNLRLGHLGHDIEAPDEILFDWFPILAERRDQRAGTLSGGEQQMLAIARALASRPKLLLLDEPSEGIQPSLVHEIGERLKAISKTMGLAMLVVEQNVDLVQTIADHVAFMDRGRIAEACTPDAATRANGPLIRYLAL